MTTPGRTTPGRTTPGRTTPGETTPGETTPEAAEPGTDEWRRPGPTREQARRDVLVGLGLAVLTAGSTELVRSLGVGAPGAPGQPEQLLWALAVALPVCLRRRYPLPVLAVVAAAFIGMQGRLVFEATMTSVCLFLALYTAGAWGRDRRATTAVRLVVVVAMFAWLVVSLSSTALRELMPDGSARSGVLDPRAAYVVLTAALNVFYFTGAWLFGDAAWRDARGRAELQRANEQLRHEREERARRAVLDERVRIARELHDVVAHHVSTMGVQAGAARRVLDLDPAAARGAMEAVEGSSRAAVEEMRRLVGVLRDGDDPVEPAPDLSRLEALVRAPRPGLDVSYSVLGRPRSVPPSTSVSAFRVVQEALTNVVRHAGARRVDVRVRWLPRALEVEVVDDGTGGRAAPPPLAGGEAGRRGLGLLGMRERLSMHGGQLDVGPRPEGGWRVRARFPLVETSVVDGVSPVGV